MKHTRRAILLSASVLGILLPATTFAAGLLCVDDSGHSVFLSHPSQDGGQFKSILDPKMSDGRIVWPGGSNWPSAASVSAGKNAGNLGFVYEAPHYLSAALPSSSAQTLAVATTQATSAPTLPVASVPTYVHLTGGTLTSAGQATNASSGDMGSSNASQGTTPPDSTPVPTPSTLLNGLVSYWKLDETGGDAVDSMGNTTLMNIGAATYAPGVIGNGATFSAAGANGQYLSIDGAAEHSPNITGDMTLGCWVKMNSQPADTYPIVSKWGTTYEGTSYRLSYQDTPGVGHQLSFATNGTTNANTLATQTLTNGTWYYVAATASGTTGTLYVDGVSVGAGAASSIKNSNATTFELGHQAGYEIAGDQEQDECGVWSHALTAQEISDLYSAGHGKQYPF